MSGDGESPALGLRKLVEARLRALAVRRPARDIVYAAGEPGSRLDVVETPGHHVSVFYEFAFVLQGRSRIVTPGRVIDLAPGQLLVVGRGVEHEEIPPDPPSDYRAFWVAIDGAVARLDDCIFMPRETYTIGPRLLLSGSTDIESIAAAIEAELDRRDWGWAQSVHGLLKYLSCILIRRLRRVTAADLHRAEALTISADPHIWRAMRAALLYCETNFRLPLRIADVAAAVGYSPDYLGHLFGKYLGSSFSDYIHGLRISAAKGLLEKRDLTISQIADSLGYTDPTNFSHAFTSATGASPRAYRRRLSGR
ncbi:MAG: AraC family transcriptional regulator [Armatimonadota bacterium]